MSGWPDKTGGVSFMGCTNHKSEETIAVHFSDAVQWRRDLHKHPQPAWLEFYATGFVAEKLAEWG